MIEGTLGFRLNDKRLSELIKESYARRLALGSLLGFLCGVRKIKTDQSLLFFQINSKIL